MTDSCRSGVSSGPKTLVARSRSSFDGFLVYEMEEGAKTLRG